MLIVEDDEDILNLLKFNFQNQGFEIISAMDGEAALKICKEIKPDIVILDLMLPGINGQEVCKRLKSQTFISDLPIIMLTAKGEEEDRISGFELGADDYVVKPFSPKELILRVNAILKRVNKLKDDKEIWEKQGLRIEFDKYRVFIDQKEIELTATEFNLLSTLVNSGGRVLTREQLLDKVWGYEFVGYARTVDTHLHRLRHKMMHYADWIQTVRGIGYRFKQ
jgi:two-component system phosphate regulon response regulator PhoB